VNEQPHDASARAQRVRIRFACGPDTSRGDLARLWREAFEAAGVEVSRSEGRRGQRIVFAAGLPQHVSSEGELVDVVLARPVRTADLIERVRAQLPPEIELREAQEVGFGLPSLPSAVRWSDYEVDVPATDGSEMAIAALLAQETLPWRDTRGEKVREYDLRSLVQELRVECAGDGVVRLAMRLRCDASGVGRPDQVVLALGLPQPLRTHRRRLVLADVSPARDAWQRRGRYVG
jgi:radical SAM-linked protein